MNFNIIRNNVIFQLWINYQFIDFPLPISANKRTIKADLEDFKKVTNPRCLYDPEQSGKA